MNSPSPSSATHVKRWALIIWPAFLSACLLEAFVFSLVDPDELHWSGAVFQVSRQGAYTMAFFCFWLISLVCSGLTWWLARLDHTIQK